jgi:hypothetical protein
LGHLRSRTQPACDRLCPQAPESACHPWGWQAALSSPARCLRVGPPAPCNVVDAAVCRGRGLQGARARVSSVHQAAERRMPGSRCLLRGEGALIARGIDIGTRREWTPGAAVVCTAPWPATPVTKCHPRDHSMVAPAVLPPEHFPPRPLAAARAARARQTPSCCDPSSEWPRWVQLRQGCTRYGSHNPGMAVGPLESSDRQCSAAGDSSPVSLGSRSWSDRPGAPARACESSANIGIEADSCPSAALVTDGRRQGRGESQAGVLTPAETSVVCRRGKRAGMG